MNQCINCIFTYFISVSSEPTTPPESTVPRKRSNSTVTASVDKPATAPVPVLVSTKSKREGPCCELPVGVEDGPTNSWSQIDATTLNVQRRNVQRTNIIR